MELKQIEGIGDVGMRKLAAADIRSIGALADTEAHRIEMILGRNPPFGNQMLSRVSDFPILRLNVKQTGKKQLSNRGAQIEFAADIGFMNTKPPFRFRRDAVYVCFLAETQNGTLLDFRRMSARKIHASPIFSVVVVLEKPSTVIKCYVSCDGIAGTGRDVELRLDAMPSSWFPSPVQGAVLGSNGNSKTHTGQVQNIGTDDIFDDDVNDAELLSMDIDDKRVEVIHHIDKVIDDHREIRTSLGKESRKRTASNLSLQSHKDKSDTAWRAPTQLANGNWTCQHDCRDEGKQCNHKCCKEGVANPRKYPRNKPLKVKPEDNSESSVPAATQKHRVTNPQTSGATKKQAKLEIDDGHGLRKMIRIDPVKKRSLDPCSVSDESFDASKSTIARELTSNEDPYHLVTGLNEADCDMGEVPMDFRDPWARSALSTSKSIATGNDLSSDGDFWNVTHFPDMVSTSSEKIGRHKTQEDLSMCGMIDQIPGIDDLLAGNIEDDLFDDEATIRAHPSSPRPRAADTGALRFETRRQKGSFAIPSMGNVTDVNDHLTQSKSEDDHNDTSFDDFDFNLDLDFFKEAMPKVDIGGKAVHPHRSDKPHDDAKTRARRPNPSLLRNQTRTCATDTTDADGGQDIRPRRPPSPDPFYATDLNRLFPPFKPTPTEAKDEEEQRQKWAGIKLPPGFEDLKDFVHLV